MENLIQEHILASSKNLSALASNTDLHSTLLRAVDEIATAYRNGGCLFAIGNGGSAADAQHLVAELVSKLNKDRTPIKAFALTTDTSILTAIGNDYGYEKVFSRQVRSNMTSKDVLLAITTSGNSPNVMLALEAAKEVGCKTILLTGPSGGKCKSMADFSILANGSHTAQIQESHLVLYHLLCYLIERKLVDLGLCKYL